jgi:hypothetical protein
MLDEVDTAIGREVEPAVGAVWRHGQRIVTR